MRFRHDLGNDRWIVEKIFPNLRGGYFVEAGATNGVNGSATYVLERELGWSGLLIEPIPFQYEQVRRFRNCRADNRALWSESNVDLQFTIFPQRTGHSGLSDVNKNIGRADFTAEEKEQINVKTVTLRDVLAEHSAPRIIHFICLDVEGAELEVLRAFDFQGEYKVLALSIEGHACDGLMRSNGYKSVKNPFTSVDFETYWLHSECCG